MQLHRRSFLQLGVVGTVAFHCRGSSVAPRICRLTEPVESGPFYRPGAPARTQIAEPGLPGERLIVTGTVMRSDCRTPIAGAVVDVWQADKDGHYDNEDPARPPNPRVFKLRGTLRTDPDGHYAIETILPGRYVVGSGLRPRHIHFTVSAPGISPLTTQLFFKGDPYVHRDPVGLVRRGLVRPVRREHHSDGSFLVCNFDIVPRMNPIGEES